MIEILFLILLLNFIYAVFNNYSFINPSTSFIFGFVMAVLVAIIYKDEWGMKELHTNTFLVIAIGVTVYNIAVKLHSGKWRITKQEHVLSKPRSIFLNKKWLIIFIFISAFITLWEYHAKISITGSANIAEALFQMDKEFKQGDIDMYQLPVVLRNVLLFRDVINVYFFYILAKMIALKSYEGKLMYVIIISIIGFIGTIFSGSRGNAVTYLLYMFYVWTIFRIRFCNSLRRMTLKKGVVTFLVLIMGGALFVKSTEWVGRSIGNLDPTYYFAIYCGAEIKNLDLFMNEKQPPNNIFGEHTFSGLIPSTKYSREQGLEFIQFREYNGYPLGNVYTVFQDLYQDFGFFGVLLLTAIMALIMQHFFINSLNSKACYCKQFDLSVCLYAYFSTAVVYSFFSDRFYGLFSWYYFKLLIELFVFVYIMDRIVLKKV